MKELILRFLLLSHFSVTSAHQPSLWLTNGCHSFHFLPFFYIIFQVCKATNCYSSELKLPQNPLIIRCKSTLRLGSIHFGPWRGHDYTHASSVSGTHWPHMLRGKFYLLWQPSLNDSREMTEIGRWIQRAACVNCLKRKSCLMNKPIPCDCWTAAVLKLG